MLFEHIVQNEAEEKKMQRDRLESGSRNGKIWISIKIGKKKEYGIIYSIYVIRPKTGDNFKNMLLSRYMISYELSLLRQTERKQAFPNFLRQCV